MKRIPEEERMDRAEAADAYANADFTEVNERFVEAVAAAMRGLRLATLLDLGSGPGDIPLALAAANLSDNIVAVDAAAEMLDWAMRRASSSTHATRVALVRGDAKTLPFPAGAFDAVVSNSILHHVADPNLFWREVARMLPRGGQVFMRDLMRPDTIQDAQALVDEYARDESEALQGEFFRSLCAAYTVEEVHEQLQKTGLETLNVRASSNRHLDVFGQVD